MASSNKKLELIKRNSRAQVTLGVQQYGPISRVDLAKATGLSLTCVSRTVDDLLSESILIETGSISRPRGRPKVLLDINPNGAPVAGLRLGPESIEIAVADPRGEILARRRVLYHEDDLHPELMVEEIAESIRQCAKSAGGDSDSIQGVGISVAGLADPLMGVVDGLTNRRGWENVPIAGLLQSKLGVPVYIDNDVRAAALASQYFSSNTGDGGALYVYVSEGVGGAYVQNNRELLRGVHDAAGLLGHIVVDPEGPLCGCGNSGCLEALASDIGFIRSIWPELPNDVSHMAISERVKLVQQGIDMVKSDDVNANEALASVTRYLGIGVATAVMILDPRVVYIFGTLIDTEPDMVIDKIRSEALKHVWLRSRGVEIRPLMNWQEFLLKGSLGLVLWQPYKQLQEENLSFWLDTGVKPGKSRRPKTSVSFE